MAEDLLTQHTVRRVIGQSRLQRLLQAGWLKPVERTAHSVLFSPRDVHLALSRAERERCPPNQIASLRVRAWEQRTGNGYQKVLARKPPGIDDISWIGARLSYEPFLLHKADRKLAEQPARASKASRMSSG